jgi:hypothetical protein
VGWGWGELAEERDELGSVVGEVYPSSEMPCDSSSSRASYPSWSSSANDSWISSSVASIPSEDMSLLFLSSAVGD